MGNYHKQFFKSKMSFPENKNNFLGNKTTNKQQTIFLYCTISHASKTCRAKSLSKAS